MGTQYLIIRSTLFLIIKYCVPLIILLFFVFLPESSQAARRWSSGFELQSATAGFEIDTINGTGVTIDTTTKRSGSASMRIQRSGGAGTTDVSVFLPSAVTQLWQRMYLNIATAPSAATGILEADNNSVLTFCGITLNTNRTLQLYYNQDVAGAATKTNIGSASTALSTGTWYRVELYSNSTNGGGCIAKLDGQVIGAQMGITDFYPPMGTSITTTYWGIDAGEWGAPYTANADLYFDDMAINDNTGTRETSWAGPGKIVYLRPNAAGDSNQWTHDDNTAAGATNYTELTETTPDDATSYLKRVNTGTLTDDYNVTDSSTAGIASTDVIKLVQVGARIGATSATATDRGAILRIKSQASGTVDTTGTIDWSINGWANNSDDTSNLYDLTSYSDPQDAATRWTSTKLDSMQIGFQNATSSTNEIRVSALWALVEYNSYSNGPLVQLKLDENSGAFTNDTTINGASGILGDGTCSAGSGTCPSWIAGRHGTGLSFDGTNDYVRVGDLDGIEGMAGLTVMTWVRANTAGAASSEKHFVDSSECTGTSGTGLFELIGGLIGSGLASFVVYVSSDGSYVGTTTGTTTIDDTAWHHVAGVYESGSAIRIYVDGRLEDAVGVGADTVNSLRMEVQLAGDCQGNGAGNAYMWNGRLDDVRIYNRALSAGEIRKAYQESNYSTMSGE